MILEDLILVASISYFEKPAPGFARRTDAKPKTAGTVFLSPGERIKGEGRTLE